MTDIEKALSLIDCYIEATNKVILTGFEGRYDMYLDRLETLKYIREALQEKAERDKGCEYCTDKHPPSLLDCESDTIWFNSKYSKFYDNGVELNWVSCPNCGRKLGE